MAKPSVEGTDGATCPYPNVQRHTRTWERTAGGAAARHRELAPGAARRDGAAARDTGAMAAMVRWAMTTFTCASKTKVELVKVN